MSVVVPAYNVEAYLDDCLTSILAQSHHGLEVIVVNDGSTDRTGEIAERVASADPRIRVHHQGNVGLGAARNAGIALATGDFLTFVDSDDLVCPGAYERLLGKLHATGSDLAIGAVHRLDGGTTYMTPLMKENHRRPMTAVEIDEVPLMLADCFAWNKVFRRSFWDRADLTFPVGVRYEDQPTITRALIEARSFDSLPDPVYQWRVRADGSSLSQQRTDLRDLDDRMETKAWATDLVQGRTSSYTQGRWFSRVLPIDMWEYFRSVPGCTDEYWSRLRSGLSSFWGPHTVPFEQTTVPPRQRVMGWLVARDRRSDLEAFLAYLDSHGGRLPRTPIGECVPWGHALTELADLPPELVVG